MRGFWAFFGHFGKNIGDVLGGFWAIFGGFLGHFWKNIRYFGRIFGELLKTNLEISWRFFREF